MISVNNLSVHFGGDPLFEHVSFIINDRDRIGLTGKNGAGKTTLLRIIKGLHAADEGEVVVPSGQTIRYLPQEMKQDSSRTVFEETITAFSEILELKEKIARLHEKIEASRDFHSPDYDRLLRDHSDALERFHLLEGQSVHVNVEKVLTGLGFEPSDFGKPMKQFSSGWQMRVELAKILLRQPHLILLDEPTNHLDIESIQWLEEYLLGYRGALMVVSHDRTFLDNVTQRTIEISLNRIFDYRANYSGYVELREERLESQLAAYSNQQRQIRQIERFIERFRYKATKARQVQSRIRMLDKMEEIGVDETDETTIRFRFPPAPHSGKIILETRHLGKTFPQKQVLRELNFSVIRNDRIAFVGRNGEGKTTLSRILAGKTDHEGLLKFGHHVVTGYYAQDQWEHLDPGRTVFQTIDDVATGDIRPKIKTLLGGFLFGGDAIEKKVKVLSGGEKSRLSLARLLLIPSNLLILDEPTNHLDMRSKDILKNALIHYDGTLIIVSHDRDFLQGLTNRVFEFRNGGIREYLGDIFDFLEDKKIRSLKQLEIQGKAPDSKKSRGEILSGNKAILEKRKIAEKELRRIRSRIARCETEIGNMESEIRKKEEILGEPDRFPHVLLNEAFYREYEALKKSLQEGFDTWTDLHTNLSLLERENDPGS